MVTQNPNKVWQLQQLTHLSYTHKPNTNFAPGTSWRYSNTTYIIARQLIKDIYRKAYGQSLTLNQILQKQLIKPYHLQNTYYFPNHLPQPLLKRMVHGYNYFTGKDFTKYNLSIAGPSGAMIANPSSSEMTNFY